MHSSWSWWRLICAGLLVVFITGGRNTLSAQALTVHVTDTATDAPVDAALVRLMRGEDVLASATTESDGTATFDLVVTTEPTAVPHAFHVSAPYPNPSTGTVRFDAVLNVPAGNAGTAPFDVTLFDVLGRRVLHASWQVAPGTHAVEADLRGLTPGVYFVRLRQAAREQVRAVVLNGRADGTPALQIRQASGTMARQAPAKQTAPMASLTVSVRKDGYAEHRLTRTFTEATSVSLGLEPVVEQVAATVGAEGGAAQLPDGVRLVVPPGGVQIGTAQVELSALHANPWFDAPHQRAVHVNVASGQVGALALHVPVATEEAAARTGVTFLADADSAYTEYLTGSYDEAAGALVVPLTGTSGKTLQGQVNGVYLIEGAVEVALTHEARLLELPYYEQDGDNCWAAAWLMLLRSYAPGLQFDAIYELLHLRDVDKNEGLSWRDMRGLTSVTAGLIGHGVAELRWTNFDNFVAYVMQNVDAGRPVLANLITHQVVFVGYEIENPGLHQTVTLIAHDPARSAYMRQPPSYFRSTYFELAWYQFRPLNQFATIAPNAPAPTGSGLTIHLPDGSLAKGLAFLGRTHDGTTLRSDWQAVVWDHTEPTGLLLDALPDSLDTIKLQRVPVWNASGTSQDVTVTSTISTMRDGAPATVYTQSTPYTIGAHGRVLHEEEVDWTDLRPPESHFTWRTDLTDGSGQRVGGFEVDFTHEPAPAYVDPFERSWTTWIPYPSQTATANLVISGGKGVRLQHEILSGGILQAILRLPRPDNTLSYTVRLSLTEMTGPIETMGWEIVDATGSHNYNGGADATHAVVVGQAGARVYIYATTSQSSRENVAALAFDPE